jgi:hypothetical protein
MFAIIVSSYTKKLLAGCPVVSNFSTNFIDNTVALRIPNAYADPQGVERHRLPGKALCQNQLTLRQD